MRPEDVGDLPGSPRIDGLVIRAFRGDVDFTPMAAVHQAAQAWDAVDPLSARDYLPDVELLAREHVGEAAGSPDLLMVEVKGHLVGYARLLWWTEADGTWVYLHLGWLMPAWRGRGIGTAMLHWSQTRAQALAATQPTEGKAVFATNVASTEREADALMQAAGYTAVRQLSDMVLTDLDHLPPAALPAGLVRRPIQAAEYREIYAAFKDAWLGIWGTIAASEADYQQFLRQNVDPATADTTLWQVAWDGDTVIGLVISHIRKGVGVVAEVAVRRSWRRRGIAHALMVHALDALRGRGVTQARLFTDAMNGQGARTLYERLAFVEVKQHVFYRKPLAAGAEAGIDSR